MQATNLYLEALQEGKTPGMPLALLQLPHSALDGVLGAEGWAESLRGALRQRRAGAPELGRGQPGHSGLKEEKRVDWSGCLAHLSPGPPPYSTALLSVLEMPLL